MAVTAASSNPLDLQLNTWDAFISFRGKDIRYGLLSHLSKALEQKQINAFTDDKLRKGEEISQALLQIIENSSVSVVIFSENYADSPWCLDELAKILECRETLEQIVLPVFYKVDPTDVQELTGSFGKEFHKLKKKRKRQDCLHKVDGWTQALDKISNLSGWDSRTIKSESELVESIVNGVLKELSLMPSNDFSNEGLCDSGRDMASQVRARPPTSSLLPAETVFGREEDKRAILGLLKDEARNAKVSVIPIVGMGGVGKTTLAQLIYNDQTLHFDLKAWVCIGEVFDIYGITEKLLKKVGVDNSSSPQEKLKEELSGKKFLIVLDDVWTENYEDWTLFCAPFVGAPGSTLIVTTRSQEVSSMMATVPAQNLKELSYDDCLSVFAQHALGETSFDKNKDLEEMGEEIVKRCQGLPLAAKALGGLLRGKPNPTAWRYVVKSKIWDLPDEKCNILPALRLSYRHLPLHLKICFAYCAIFPKDYDFDSKGLVLLWMAAGFLRPKGKMQMEELGDQYFCDLLSRSFFQRSGSNESLFVMHDLMNDLARSISGERCFQLGDKLEDGKSYAKVYYSSFLSHEYDISQRFEVFYEMRSLRTFLALSIWNDYGFHYLSGKVLHDLVPKLKCLRTLSLSGYRFKELPNSVGDLKHLRYLNLSRTNIEKLPESVCELFNLQTLILRACYRLVELPKDLQNLNNLLYLDISDTESLKEMPVQVGNLTNLYMLPKFIVRKGNGLGINMLMKFSHLQGQLRIMDLQNVLDVQDVDFPILKGKEGLDKLALEWFDDFRGPRNVNDELEVLERLQPHHNLSRLEIISFGGVVFPFWTADRRFTHMVHLKLCNCRKVRSLPPLGRLPSLEELNIEGMDELKEVGAEFYEDSSCFALLKTLIVKNMLEWERWDWSNGLNKAGTEQFPNLCRLKIENCPKLVGELPNCLPTLESLTIEWCKEVNLRKMSNISSLTSLRIWGISGLVSLPEALIEALVALEEFTIGKCDELAYLWRDGANLENLSRLKSLEIENCKELVCLVEGEEGILPCNLQVLKISVCGNLEKLPNGLHCLTSLRVLDVDQCDKLLSYPEKGLPQLEELSINYCPSFPHGEFPNSLKLLALGLQSYTTQLLESLYDGLPHLTYLSIGNVSEFPEKGLLIPSLVSLDIYYGKDLRSLPNQMQNLKSLKNLEIISCHQLESFPDGGLPIPTLTHLRITLCKKLRSLPSKMQNLTSLQSLWIFALEALLSFPEGGLPHNLTVLSIESCKNLTQPMSEWGLNRLTSLEEFIISGPCPSTDMVVSFPDNDGLQLPNSLAKINISGFKNLQSISRGVQRLTSLQRLYIFQCPALQSLPKEGLPATLGCFRTDYCPLLEVHCSKDKGDLWPIIADIPFIYIK